jgi:hypothetical protein
VSYHRRETFIAATTPAAMHPSRLDEVPVATKIVDVFVKDAFLRSYEFDWNITHAPPFEQDFIDRARQQMQADGYAGEQIADARFVVRD